jgi:hypothetical protein
MQRNAPISKHKKSGRQYRLSFNDMNSNKQYRLNHQAKVFSKVECHKKKITISSVIFDSLNEKKLSVLKELVKDYRYTVQLILP